MAVQYLTAECCELGGNANGDEIHRLKTEREGATAGRALNLLDDLRISAAAIGAAIANDEELGALMHDVVLLEAAAKAPPMDKRCRPPKKGAATVRGEGLKGGHCIEDSLRFTNGMNLDGSSTSYGSSTLAAPTTS